MSRLLYSSAVQPRRSCRADMHVWRRAFNGSGVAGVWAAYLARFSSQCPGFHNRVPRVEPARVVHYAQFAVDTRRRVGELSALLPLPRMPQKRSRSGSGDGARSGNGNGNGNGVRDMAVALFTVALLYVITGGVEIASGEVLYERDAFLSGALPQTPRVFLHCVPWRCGWMSRAHGYRRSIH